MTATVRVYKSTDTSAPVLTGQVGSLVALLDACLVNGYGSSTAAGWTKPYTATNKAVFYMGAGTPRMYLDVDDTNAQDGRCIGYETMSAVATGTGPFPTTAQLSAGTYLRKSSTADATARPWLLIACERAFYLWTFAAQSTYTSTASTDSGMFFGAFPTYKSGDAYNVHLIGSIGAGGSNSLLGRLASVSGSGFTAVTGSWVPRAYTQIGISLATARAVPAVTAGATMGTFGGGYTDAITGGLKLAKVIVAEPDGGSLIIERGYMPGYWNPMHNLPGNNFDTFTGTGALAGKSFLLVPVYNQNLGTGRAAIETAGSWDL